MGIGPADSDVLMEDNEFENSDEDFQNGEDDDDEDDDISVGGWEEDYQDPVARIRQHSSAEKDEFSQDTLNPVEVRKLRKALRHDLRLAKIAGFKIGVLGDYQGGVDLYVSLGIKVSKLGISDEAIDAWKLDKQKYLIMLIHYSSYYQTLERLTGDVGGYHAKKSVELCVGTATKYKPTLIEAIGAFSKISAFDNAHPLSNGTSKEGDGLDGIIEDMSDDGAFRGVFISRPLNELLNSRLIQLVKYRIQHGFGWDGAERYYIGEKDQ
jgi:ubiquitin-conjugating enzyme E2 Q